MQFDKCEQIFDKTCKGKKLHEAVVLIEDMSGKISWSRELNRTVDSPMNMASITKLFVTTCVLQLCEQKKLAPDHKINRYLDRSIMKGLHIYKGTDYSDSLTINDLLFQVSGLPDYFYKAPEGGLSFEKRIAQGDCYVPFDEMIKIGKTMTPIFEPRRKGRAYYADINFDLLGKIVEGIYGMTLQEIYKKQIFEPLGLKSTYVVASENDLTVPVYKNGFSHSIPKFLSSVPASGGGVTTAKELMIFLKAFWTGKLFDKKVFERLREHNKLQMVYGSVQYSGGHMYIHASFPFVKKNTMRGHSGSTGSFAFYCEETDMFFVGDVNDFRSYVPINMMLKLESCCRD